MAINERRLRYFAAVAEHSTMRAAARSLAISEPTLSVGIRRLEEELDLVLFHRLGRRLELSDAGRALLQSTGHALRALDTVSEIAAGLARSDLGSTSVAASPGVGVSPFAEILERLARTHPELRVETVRTLNALETIARVQDGTAELGLVPRVKPPPGMVAHEVGRYELVLAFPPGTAPPGAVADEALDGRRFIAGSPGGMTAAALERIRRSGAEPHVVLVGPHPTALPALVRRGVGAALVTTGLAEPLHAVGAEIRPLQIPARTVIRIVHRDMALSPASRAYVGAAIEVAREARSREG